MDSHPKSFGQATLRPCCDGVNCGKSVSTSRQSRQARIVRVKRQDRNRCPKAGSFQLPRRPDRRSAQGFCGCVSILVRLGRTVDPSSAGRGQGANVQSDRRGTGRLVRASAAGGEGKDGNAMNELRLLALVVTGHRGYFPSVPEIKWRPAASVTVYRAGDRIRLSDFYAAGGCMFGRDSR